MKSLLYILLALSLFCACSDEPEFPDPGLDTTRTSRDTVRLDTIDTYMISMNVEAPNGIERIQLLNGRNYEVLEEFTEEYRGMKNFIFEYPVDLTGLQVDTTLLYIVKVIDKDMRSYNKGFTLNVLKHSAPEIKLVGTSEILGLVSPVFEIKMLFETGLNTIRSYRVLFEGNVVDEATFDEPLHEYKYKNIFDVDMIMGEEYSLRIELTDDKGTVGVKDLKLRLIEAKRPRKVTVSTSEKGLAADIEFYYNELNRLDSLVCTNYRKQMVNGQLINVGYYSRYDFEYTEEGMVSRIVYVSGDGERINEYSYVSGTKQLSGICDPEYPSSDITIAEWYNDGNVKSYYVGTNAIPIDDIYYTDDLKGDSKIFAEYWVARGARQHCVDMTSIQIPTYFPELPPVLCGTKNYWAELFLYKYAFAKTIETETEKEKTQLACFTDNIGQVVRLRRVEPDIFGRESYTEYVFSYE